MDTESKTSSAKPAAPAAKPTPSPSPATMASALDPWTKAQSDFMIGLMQCAAANMQAAAKAGEFALSCATHWTEAANHSLQAGSDWETEAAGTPANAYADVVNALLEGHQKQLANAVELAERNGSAVWAPWIALVGRTASSSAQFADR